MAITVQEHRLQIEQQDKKIDEVMLNSGGFFVFTPGKRKGQGGVGLFFNKKASDRLLFVDKINDRIIVANLEANPNLVVVAAYGPTNSAAGEKAEEERDEFYHQL